MIPAYIHVMPRLDNSDQIDGWRVCVAQVPGCVIILRDRNKAAEIVTAAIQALIEDQLPPPRN